jgi:tetratricopeptide (TPR) repeat protein
MPVQLWVLPTMSRPTTRLLVLAVGVVLLFGQREAQAQNRALFHPPNFTVPVLPEIEVPEAPDHSTISFPHRPDPWNVVRPPSPAEQKQVPVAPPRILNDWEKCTTRSQDIEEVLRSCSFLIQDPETPVDRRVRALQIRAAINENAGLSIPALADLNEIIALSPRTIGAHERRGSIWLREKNFDQALKDFAAAIRLQPKAAELHVLRGIAHRNTGEIAKALADFETSISLNPRYEIAYYERGLTQLEKKEYAAALSDFRYALQLNPRFALGFYGIGTAYSEQNETVLAIAAFTEVQKLDPQLTALVQWQKGLVRQRAGDCKSALEDYAAALSAGLRTANIIKNRGICWRILGQFDFAILELTQTIAIAPRDADAYLERGIAKAQKGDSDGALTDFNEAIKVKPEMHTAYFSRGQILRARNQFDLAISDFGKSLSIQPTAAAFTERGITHVRLADYDLALRDFDAALKLDRNHPMAALARNLALRKSRDPRFSESDLKNAVGKHPDLLRRAQDLGLIEN